MSTSGIAYTDAVSALLDVTTDRIIDFDSTELIRSRKPLEKLAKEAAPKAANEATKEIEQKNKAIVDSVGEIRRFQSQTKLLKAYFHDLQALADSPVKDDVGGAVQSLSDRISKLNTALGSKDGKEKLSAEQKKQIGALGGLVAEGIQAEKVKHALTRDAEVIGTYLALQELQIKDISDILRDRFDAGNELFLNQYVRGPYADVAKQLPDKWAANRKQWVTTQFASQQLNTAQEAAKHLRAVWTDILQGKNDVNSLRSMISDVNEFVTTIQALEAAGKAK